MVMTMLTDKEIYEHHVLFGTYETVEYLEFYFRDLSKKTLKRIIDLCFEINFPKDIVPCLQKRGG